MKDGIQEINEQQSKSPALSNGPRARTVKSRSRTIPPFIVAHDVPRGILYATQMLVSYLLMLAIMSVFNFALAV
jgi:copper transporter 1